MSFVSFSVGFSPRDLITLITDFVGIVPVAFLSKIANASFTSVVKRNEIVGLMNQMVQNTFVGESQDFNQICKPFTRLMKSLSK